VPKTQVLISSTGIVKLYPKFGGACESYVSDVASMISLKDLDFRIASDYRPGYKFADHCIPVHSPIDSFPLPPWKSALAHMIGGSLTAAAVLKSQADVIHLNEEVSAAIVTSLDKSAAKVVTLHNPPPELGHVDGSGERALRHGGFAFQKDTVYDGCDAVIALNSLVKSFLVKQGVPESKISLIPLPVDTGSITPGDRHLKSGREILFVGRIESRKRVDVLIRAVSKLPSSNLTVVGDGVEKPHLEALARSLGAADRVRFVGKVGQDQLMNAYRRADMFVLPSLLETSPRVVIEAAAAGLPVVLPDVPLYDFFRPHRFVSWFKDDGSLVDTLGSLCGDSVMLRQLGENARRFAVENVSYETTSQKLVDLYLKLS
jgi:glycosyltransferase involved in cell wall biosynthesis